MYRFYKRNNFLIDPSPKIKQFVKNILGKYFDKNKNIENNYKLIDRIIFKTYIFSPYQMKKKYEYFFQNIMDQMRQIFKDESYKDFKIEKEEIECLFYALIDIQFQN